MPIFRPINRIFRSDSIDRTWQNIHPDVIFCSDEHAIGPKEVDISLSTESESNTSHSNEDQVLPAPSEAAATYHSDEGEDEEEQFEDEPRDRPVSLFNDLSPDVHALYEWQRRYQVQQCAAYIEQSEDEAFSYTVDEQDGGEQDLENFQFADEPSPTDDLEWQEEGRGQVGGEPTAVGLARFLPIFGRRGDAPPAPQATEEQQEQQQKQEQEQEQQEQQQPPPPPPPPTKTQFSVPDGPDKAMIGTARGNPAATLWWLLSLGALCLGFVVVLAPYLIYDDSKASGSGANMGGVPTTSPTNHPMMAPTTPPSTNVANRPTAAPLNIETETEYALHMHPNVTVDVLIDISNYLSTLLYEVTDDTVGVLDSCDDKKWTKRAVLLYSSGSSDNVGDNEGSLSLSFDIVNGIDTTFVECQNEIVTKTYYHTFVGSEEENGGATPSKASLDKIDFTATMEFIKVSNVVEVSISEPGAGVVLLIPDPLSDVTVEFFVFPDLETRRLGEPDREHIHARPQVGDPCPPQVTWLPAQSSSILSQMTLWRIPRAAMLGGPSRDDARTVYVCSNRKIITGVGRVVVPDDTSLVPWPTSAPSQYDDE